MIGYRLNGVDPSGKPQWVPVETVEALKTPPPKPPAPPSPVFVRKPHSPARAWLFCGLAIAAGIWSPGITFAVMLASIPFVIAYLIFDRK